MTSLLRIRLIIIMAEDEFSKFVVKPEKMQRASDTGHFYCSVPATSAPYERIFIVRLERPIDRKMMFTLRGNDFTSLSA